jgi:hypothetical protein
VTVKGLDGTAIGSHTFDHNARGTEFSVQAPKKEFHSLIVEAANTPPQNSKPKYVLGVTYTAPQKL